MQLRSAVLPEAASCKQHIAKLILDQDNCLYVSGTYRYEQSRFLKIATAVSASGRQHEKLLIM